MSPSSTSSSDRRGLGAFCLRCALFAAPLLLVVGLFESMMWASGESWPMQKIATAHESRSELLVRSQYFSQSYAFKFDRVRMLKPDVIALGTSRVLEYRGLFFDEPRVTFYNGGGMLGSFADITAYVDAVKTGNLPAPKAAIFGIDPWWLKAGLPEAKPMWADDPQYADPSLLPEPHIIAMRAFIKQSGLPWPGRIGWALSPSPIAAYPAIGGAALGKGVGFRHDGSYQYDPNQVIETHHKPVYADRETPPVIERIRDGTEQFTPAAALDTGRVSRLISELSRLRGLGVEVHVVLPPFANECFDALESDKERHGWWPAYRQELPKLLQNAGITCLPPTSPRDHGMDDISMWDGFHPGEVLMLRIFRDLVRHSAQDSQLRKLVSPRLDSLETATTHPLTLEPSRFFR